MRDWGKLHAVICGVVGDLHFILNTQSVGCFLVDWVNTLSTISQPANELERDALILTVRAGYTYLSEACCIEEELGHSVCAEYLERSVNALQDALYAYDQ